MLNADSEEYMLAQSRVMAVQGERKVRDSSKVKFTGHNRHYSVASC